MRKSLLLACALLALVPLACQSFRQGLNPYPPEFLPVSYTHLTLPTN